MYDQLKEWKTAILRQQPVNSYRNADNSVDFSSMNNGIMYPQNIEAKFKTEVTLKIFT
eukprot:UN19101